VPTLTHASGLLRSQNALHSILTWQAHFIGFVLEQGHLLPFLRFLSRQQDRTAHWRTFVNPARTSLKWRKLNVYKFWVSLLGSQLSSLSTIFFHSKVSNEMIKSFHRADISQPRSINTLGVILIHSDVCLAEVHAV
jgi:hypothetical protein